MIHQVVFEALGLAAVHEAAEPPEPGPGEVLLAPAFVGLCGTDLHVLHGKHPWVKPPLVTGHEMAGRVDRTGPGVDDLRPGDAVVLDPLVPCGQCRNCRRGSFNTCEKARVIGFRLPGAAQTSFVTSRRQLHRVPRGLALEHAVLAEPLAVGVHAAALWDDLEDVLVIGGGTIGLCLVAALKARGAERVTVIEPVASKRDRALRLGATAAFAPGVVETVPQFTACFDVVATQATADLACTAVLSGGAVAMVGVAAGPLLLNIPRLQRFEITTRGSGMYLGADIAEALRLLAAGRVDPTVFVTGTRMLAEAAEAYADATEPENVKILIQMH